MAEYEMTMGGCGPCVCKKCLLWWSGRCPRGGCWDEWRAVHEPWPGPVRRQWTNWDKPGEQAHWCRGGTCYAALACPDYIKYEADKAIVQDCLEGAVVKYQDGYIQCSMIDVMGCEECYRRFEERIEGKEIGMIESANTNELQGQYTLDDLLPKQGTGGQGAEIPEGYDAEGNLLNVDALPPQTVGASGDREAETSSDPGEAGATFPNGGRPEGAQTPADANGAEVSGGTVLSDTPTTAGAGDSIKAMTPVDAGVSGEPSPTDTTDTRLSILATEIKAITEQTRGVVISAALAVGKRLIEAKSICPAGRFGEWLESAVNYSERKAQDMMRLYLEYGRNGSIPESIAALDYSKAVALLSAPAAAREALAGMAAEEDLSVRELAQEIKRLKAEKLKDQMRIEGLEAQIDTARDNIQELTDEGNRQDQAIVDRDREIEQKEEELKAAKRVIADAAEKVSLAQAKAAAAEASAEELRKLHSDAEDRAAASAQRASDAVNRANQAAKDLAEAKARIAELREQGTGNREQEVRTVEVVPEDVRREIEQLKRELAEARALSAAAGTSSDPAKAGPPDARRLARAYGPPKGEGSEASATEKFKWFYANQMKPTFTTALNLLREVAREDGKAADAFATALTNACRVLMNQLGNGD